MAISSSYKARGPFHIVEDENLVYVWLGIPNDPESELLLSVDRFYLPTLIASLRMVQEP